MAITRSVWVDDDGSGTTGTVLNNAELQKIYNNIDALAGAFWTSIPFSTAMYTGTSGTVIPSAGTTYWTTVGRVAFLAFSIAGTMSISQSTVSIYITLPGAPLPSFTGSTVYGTFHYYIGNGQIGTGYLETVVPNRLRLTKDAGGTPFTAAAAGTAAYLWGQIFYPF